MKNTIISCVVAVLCVIALCVTYASCTPGSADSAVSGAYADYLSEEEAAEYIGVSTEIMQMMRTKLGYFKGAYMNYMYLEDGKQVESIVYNRDALNEAVDKLNKEVGALNFKFLQEQK
jgi:aspartate ammonia-lyase